MQSVTDSRYLRRAAAASCLAMLLSISMTACATAPALPQGFEGWPRATIGIQTRIGIVRFNTTIADTAIRQQQGLMFVRELDARESMWFPVAPPRRMQMWMRNTLIPLDMLFVDPKGRIACIAARTTPQALDLISCPTVVSGVLEIGGGEAERQGIGVGDQLRLSAAARP